jgi:hypothetical protein
MSYYSSINPDGSSSYRQSDASIRESTTYRPSYSSGSYSTASQEQQVASKKPNPQPKKGGKTYRKIKHKKHRSRKNKSKRRKQRK